MRILPRPMFRRAFTTIEILTAVAIIALLASIAIVGMKHMVSSSKSTSAHVDVQNLLSMTTELSSAGVLKRPAKWRWGTATVIAVPLPDTSTPTNADSFDFWTVPFRDGTAVNDPPSPLLSPGSVDDVNFAVWKTDAAIVNTAIALSRLTLVPTNKTAFEKYPVDRRKTIPNDASTPVDESRVPLLTDQWGRPMIFVPASGLTNVRVADVLYSSANSDPKLRAITAPDNRYFWASAGEDGDFSKGDDNVYSFEK